MKINLPFIHKCDFCPWYIYPWDLKKDNHKNYHSFCLEQAKQESLENEAKQAKQVSLEKDFSKTFCLEQWTE